MTRSKPAQRISAREAAALVRSGDWLDYGAVLGQPGGYDRKHGDAGLQNYIPCNLGEISDHYRRFIDPPDMMVVKTCPIDANGYFNLSAANLWHRAVAS